MANSQLISDKAAISLSFLCVVHCLVLPLAVVLIPSMAALPLQDESFHLWMIFAVIPISIFALTMGCKNHERYQLLIIGGLGLVVLASAALLGHDWLGEELEKAFTVIGAVIIAAAHMWNYRLCQRVNECACSDPENT